MKELFRIAYELDRRNLPFALVTVIGTDGIIPRQNGRMLVREDGSFTSTIGGHLIEDEAVKASVEAILEGRGRRISVDTGKGSMELMIDVVNQRRTAYLVGYGHVGKALAATLHSIGFSVHIYDIRPVECDWAAEIHVGDCWKDILSGLVLDSRSSLIVTVHSKEDILSYIDYSSAFYVGVMGTRSRVMPDKGIHTPAGLDAGAETPEEVAVSISAEILRLYNRRSGMSSRERRWRFIVVRGEGEYAAAAIMRLHGAGYDVLGTGLSCPQSLDCRVIDEPGECFHAFDDGVIPFLIDDGSSAISALAPTVVIDSSGGQSGPGRKEVPFLVSIGGSVADVDARIGTVPGVDLGRVIYSGASLPSPSDVTPDDAYAVAGGVLEAVDGFFSGYGRY